MQSTLLIPMTTLAAALATPAATLARQTRVEVARPSTPQADSKPNSDEVPDVYAASGRFERVVVLRLKFGTDLLAGIEKMADELKIRNAVILSGTGSVRSYHFHCVSNRTFPSKNIFVKDAAASADLVSMNGYVINGRVHAHVTLSDDKHAFGGHLEPETNVFTFAIVTLGIFDEGVDLSRADDKTYR